MTWFNGSTDTVSDTRNFAPIGGSDDRLTVEPTPGFSVRTVTPVVQDRVVARPAFVEMERVFAQPEVGLSFSDGGFGPSMAPPVSASRSLPFLSFASRSSLFPEQIKARLDSLVPIAMLPVTDKGKPRPRPSWAPMQPIQLDKPAVTAYPGPEFVAKKLSPSPLALRDQPLGSTVKVGSGKGFALVAVALVAIGVAAWMSRG